jgi:chemotaxis protein methyltransferase CheR
VIPGIEIPSLKDRDFARIRDLAYERFGLHLNDGKQSLVSSRLGKLIRQGRFASFQDYYEHVVNDTSGRALTAMIDCLTTNHTSFLREPDHFSFLAKRIAPEYRGRRLRIWSAACSTGEEPYSVLFTALAEGGADPGQVEIRATDISTRVLETARRGIYPPDRLTTAPPEWKTRFLTKCGDKYEVKPEYTRLITFERLNLIDKFPGTATYNVIFCRNVMIYFDRETRADLVRRLSQRLDPGGYLFVGHAESLIGIDHSLTYIQPAVYRTRMPGQGAKR